MSVEKSATWICRRYEQGSDGRRLPSLPCRLLVPQSLLPPSSTPTPSVPSSHPAPFLRPCLPSDSLTLFVPPLCLSLPSTPRCLRPCLPSVPSSPAFPSAPSLPLSFSLSRTTIFLRFTHSRGLKLPPLKVVSGGSGGSSLSPSRLDLVCIGWIDLVIGRGEEVGWRSKTLTLTLNLTPSQEEEKSSGNSRSSIIIDQK
ncbi:hypothetical protein RJT34_11246 [Clitoria ternatea]|uniref:Uncharacterized protein n=1 Tax=Clitoria ternatea TaxID=43366 RepID=A0AAN9JJS0_CLITE